MRYLCYNDKPDDIVRILSKKIEKKERNQEREEKRGLARLENCAFDCPIYIFIYTSLTILSIPVKNISLR